MQFSKQRFGPPPVKIPQSVCTSRAACPPVADAYSFGLKLRAALWSAEHEPGRNRRAVSERPRGVERLGGGPGSPLFAPRSIIKQDPPLGAASPISSGAPMQASKPRDLLLVGAKARQKAATAQKHVATRLGCMYQRWSVASNIYRRLGYERHQAFFCITSGTPSGFFRWRGPGG